MRFLDFARLVRLPNVFTAMADICLAALVTAALPERLLPFLLLLAASTCLYWSGMIWNDYFDLAQDRRERPFRPLASGQVSLATGKTLGAGLMVTGIVCAFFASNVAWPVALALAIAILLYDGVLKATWAGPVLMGTCRFLNVMLGLAVTGQAPPTWGVAIAFVVGVYIVGVTWFARTEAHVSNQAMLIVGASIMLAGLILALTVPPLADRAERAPQTSFFFPYLLAALGFYVGIPVLRAIRQPASVRVQAAVKRAIFGLVALDAILATGLVGLGGLAILLLLVPAHFLGQWVYST